MTLHSAAERSAVDIVDVSGSQKDGQARIKPGSRGEIRVAQVELAAWLVGQPLPVRIAGGVIIGHLNAAMVGDRPHPTVMEWLIEDIEKLRQARAHLTSSTPGH